MLGGRRRAMIAVMAVSLAGCSNATPEGRSSATPTTPPSATTSPAPTSTISPAADDPAAVDVCLRSSDAQVVSFQVPDGVPLVGALLGRGTKGVLLAHQGNATLCDWLPFGQTLAQRGYL